MKPAARPPSNPPPNNPPGRPARPGDGDVAGVAGLVAFGCVIVRCIGAAVEGAVAVGGGAE